MQRLATLVATICAAVAIVGLSACGTAASDAGEGTTTGETTLGVGEERAGSTSALAQCSDWVDGTDEEKQATVDDLYNLVNQAGADGPTPDLSDEDAFELFEKTCVQDYASTFRLYKLYLRSAAFAQIREASGVAP